MRLILAPMQGVLDHIMRELLTPYNSYDLCETEFVRVVNCKLPPKVYYRICPELHNQGKTQGGTPVRVQLLGSEPNWLAENAQLAIELGSQGVDLNCGCPSKTVNGSAGGASLLKDPELIYRVTFAMRQAVPKPQILSVKVRLGWSDTSQALEIAQAVQAGGADEITIHGRTKMEGYRRECINWQKIGEVRQQLQIPVIANGDITDSATLQACQQQSGCEVFMVGRGALAMPNLSMVLRGKQAPMPWDKVLELLQYLGEMNYPYDHGFYNGSRLKQWLKMLSANYPQAEDFFVKIKTCHYQQDLRQFIANLKI